MFLYAEVCSAYIMWPKQSNPWQALPVIGGIVVVSALTRCTLLHAVCDLKIAQMNLKRNLIRNPSFPISNWVITLRKKAKSFCCAKVEGRSRSQYSNQMVQEILLILKETWWSDNVIRAEEGRFRRCVPSHRWKSDE